MSYLVNGLLNFFSHHRLVLEFRTNFNSITLNFVNCSDENLIKDTFLRGKMDEQGWVPISLIATFKRVGYKKIIFSFYFFILLMIHCFYPFLILFIVFNTNFIYY